MAGTPEDVSHARLASICFPQAITAPSRTPCARRPAGIEDHIETNEAGRRAACAVPSCCVRPQQGTDGLMAGPASRAPMAGPILFLALFLTVFGPHSAGAQHMMDGNMTSPAANLTGPCFTDPTDIRACGNFTYPHTSAVAGGGLRRQACIGLVCSSSVHRVFRGPGSAPVRVPPCCASACDHITHALMGAQQTLSALLDRALCLHSTILRHAVCGPLSSMREHCQTWASSCTLPSG